MSVRYVFSDPRTSQVHELISLHRIGNRSLVSLEVPLGVTSAPVPEVALEEAALEVPQVVADRFMSQTFVPS